MWCVCVDRMSVEVPVMMLNSPNRVVSERAPMSGRSASVTPSAIDTRPPRPPRVHIACSLAGLPCQKVGMTSVVPVVSAQVAMHGVSISVVRPGRSKATKLAVNESRARKRYPATGLARSLLNARAVSLSAVMNA